jgi:hypothetical protein
MGLFDEKTEGQKSRDTVPLRHFYSIEKMRSLTENAIYKFCLRKILDTGRFVKYGLLCTVQII